MYRSSIECKTDDSWKIYRSKSKLNDEKLIPMVIVVFLKDTILHYIDEQICSRLNGKSKRNCQKMIDENGRDLIKKIEQGIVRRQTTNVLFCFYISYSLATIASLYTFSSLFG